MSTMDDVRDSMFETAERVAQRSLTSAEKSALVQEYNAASGTIFDRCRASIESVLGVDLERRALLEKSASVDRVRSALLNLRAVATSASLARAKK